MHADSWAQVVLIKCLIMTTRLTVLSEFKFSVLETTSHLDSKGR